MNLILVSRMLSMPAKTRFPVSAKESTSVLSEPRARQVIPLTTDLARISSALDKNCTFFRIR
jgi:hypothetical protein